METKTCNFIILLTKLLFLFIAVPSFAQSNTANGNAMEKVPLYNGISLGVDLYGLGAKALGSDFLSTEVSVNVNLKNRFFPVAEVGFGTTDAWNEQGTNYKSTAPYFRVGMNYNTMYKKKKKGYLYVGARYAFSSFSYDIESMDIDDPIWNTSLGNPNLKDEIWGVYTPAFNHKGLKGNMHWFEFVLGVEAQIYKEIYMGWSMRIKSKLSDSPGEYGDSWYVPGFGTYGSSTIGLTYSIIYKLPFK